MRTRATARAVAIAALAAIVHAGCSWDWDGLDPRTADAETGDGSSGDGDVDTGPPCGANGQDCCGGTTCNEGLMCTGGQCTTCADGLTACASGCVNLQTDNGNCGGCGHHCTGHSQCLFGGCN